MPIDVTVTLYRYNELSDKAKEKARNWYFSTLYWPEELEPTIDHWREIAEKLGFEIDRNGGPWWDLHYGIFKIGRGRFSRPFNDDLDTLERAYKPHPETGWEGNSDVLSIIHEVRAIHSDFYATIEDGKVDSFNLPPDYDMEPDSDDKEEWDAYYAQMRKLEEDSVERLEDALSELQHLGLKWLQSASDYLESEEAIEEAMEANEWLFHEDGTRAYYY